MKLFIELVVCFTTISEFLLTETLLKKGSRNALTITETFLKVHEIFGNRQVVFTSLYFSMFETGT